jgi:hypothetical protein
MLTATKYLEKENRKQRKRKQKKENREKENRKKKTRTFLARRCQNSFNQAFQIYKFAERLARFRAARSIIH